MATGKYSIQRVRLRDKVRLLEQDTDPWDIGEELAIARGLLQEFMDTLPRDENKRLPPATITRMFEYLEALTKMAERFNRIRNDNAMTMAEVAYVQAVIAHLFNTYVPKETRDAALRELSESIPVPRNYRLEITAGGGQELLTSGETNGVGTVHTGLAE